jgi:hypothetical protein
MILESNWSIFIVTGGRVLASYDKHCESVGTANRASLDMNEEVEQELCDKEADPVVLDVEIFLEYYVRRVKTLKSPRTLRRSTKMLYLLLSRIE